MSALNTIAKFDNKLLLAFAKMIKGINVELSDKGKETYKNANIKTLGRWHFISSIDADEKIILCSQSNHVFEGLDLSDIIL